ncbi:MAG: serine hydrolase domain-containing protein [Ilumatobacteraceae bacterium]
MNLQSSTISPSEPGGACRRIALAAVATLAVSVFGAGCGSASLTPTRSSVVDRAELQTELDTLVDLGVPGVVVMVSEGGQSVTVTAGVSDLGAGTAMDAGATFRIASMTKPYTATVVLQLVEEGILHLDDTVEQWLPGIVANGDEINIRELLHHTSGVADYFDDPAVLQPYLEGDFEHVWTPRELVEVADDLGSTSPPGSEWRYSNTNYAIAGLIVEAASGHSLGDEMQARIFDELGLEHTTFATSTAFDAHMARGYLLGGDAPIDSTGVYPFPWGAGNIVSDAADATTFYSALLSGDLLSPSMLAQMLPATDDDVMYGLGVMAWRFPCGVAYGHDGGFAGYSTRSLVLADGRQVVILSNSTTLDDQLTPDPASGDQFEAIVEDAICG